MPTAPRQLPRRPAAGDPRTTAERGYGAEHQRERRRLLQRFPLCQRCNSAWSRHLHHRDRNPHNRHPDNLEALCPRCHRLEHS